MKFDKAWVITVGGKTKPQLLERLHGEGIRMNPYAETLFSEPLFTTTEESYNLRMVEVSLEQIGLPKGGVMAEVVAKAQAHGLELCPLELAPYLRLQYLDQPEGPYLTVASQKIKDDEDFPNGFYLRRLEGQLWLRGYKAASEYVWGPEDGFTQFVFVAHQG